MSDVYFLQLGETRVVTVWPRRNLLYMRRCVEGFLVIDEESTIGR